MLNFFTLLNILKKGIIYIENATSFRIDGRNGSEHLLCNTRIKKFNFGSRPSREISCATKIDEIIPVSDWCVVHYTILG